MTPGGQYDSVKKYIDHLNDTMSDMEYYHLETLQGRYPMYFYYTGDGKVKCRWNYFKNQWGRLFVFPILGKKSQQLLGMGNILDKENVAFRNMIASMINHEEHVILPYKHKLTHATDDILVTANIIGETGGFKGEDSKVLRVV